MFRNIEKSHFNFEILSNHVQLIFINEIFFKMNARALALTTFRYPCKKLDTDGV